MQRRIRRPPQITGLRQLSIERDCVCSRAEKGRELRARESKVISGGCLATIRCTPGVRFHDHLATAHRARSKKKCRTLKVNGLSQELPRRADGFRTHEMRRLQKSAC